MGKSLKASPLYFQESTHQNLHDSLSSSIDVHLLSLFTFLVHTNHPEATFKVRSGGNLLSALYLKLAILNEVLR